MTTVGCTGHQTLSEATRRSVARAISRQLRDLGDGLVGICSLAIGTDQIFARAVLAVGGELRVIVPSQRYADTFATPADREEYFELLGLASDTTVLGFDNPSEDAFMAAGHEIVKHCDVLLAVWDGKPAAGWGGTADVVAYAREIGTEVRVVWPDGSTRH